MEYAGERRYQNRKAMKLSILSYGFEGVKRTVADYLNRNVNLLTPKHRRISFVLVISQFAILCLLHIIQSVNGDEINATLATGRITLPKDIHQPRNKRNRLQEYAECKDSLKKSQEELVVYDSLINARPGSPDSINSTI